eukprot:TRINITY_DN6804_c1_g1_i1.p1 TRINITY_DN6804_c1_g1~~TRINITY_DN6804_c1_g1_i1.p1  ORF type:complete len:317 (+),score=58.83 TRINITY_DN6804_c1_g1_i1:96-953(+)
MAAARWPKSELVLLSLQRVAWPGNLKVPSDDYGVELLKSLLELILAQPDWVAADDQTARLTMLWALRWSSALVQERVPEAVARLRSHVLQIVDHLWQSASQQVSSAGVALHWALMKGGDEFNRMRHQLSASSAQVICQASLAHLLGHDECDQLLFILKAKECQQEKLCSWFAKRHLSFKGPGYVGHLADMILWGLAAAQEAKLTTPSVWRWFWRLASEDRQAQMDFIWMAKESLYARDVLRQVFAAQLGEGVLTDAQILHSLQARQADPSLVAALSRVLTTTSHR